MFDFLLTIIQSIFKSLNLWWKWQRATISSAEREQKKLFDPIPIMRYYQEIIKIK